jgi:predicted Zn-dependent protease
MPRLGHSTAIASAIGVSIVIASCAISPLGRRQLAFFPDDQLNQMGVAAFAQVKAETKVSSDPNANSYVKCVANRITATLSPAESPIRNWEVLVFASDQANAFALPGGKIGVYTGLLKVAKNQDQLAAVVGHEVAHVLARHANERVSTAYAAEASLAAVSASGAVSPQLMGLMGLGTQVGVLLPFGRTQESEADLLGLDLMARAGFDPRQSVALWQNMNASRQRGAPPEFLSTHPSDATRMSNLNSRMPRANSLYEAAKAAGRRPRCG